jgi:zinc-ribbon domain
MAFCNSCGASLAEGTKFCNRCGAAVGGDPGGMAAVRPAQTAVPPPPSRDSSSALKIILIIVGVIVLFGVLGIGALTFVGYRLARSSHVTQNGDHVKVETPFGTVESSKDPEQAAKDLGIDIYPGAEVQKAGSASATFGGIHTVTANFKSSDSADKVCRFYRSKLPSANVTTSDQNRCTMVSNVPPNMVTINVEPDGDGSKFMISSVSKKTGSNP